MKRRGASILRGIKILARTLSQAGIEAREEVLNRATRHGNLGSAFTRKLGLLGASSVQKTLVPRHHACPSTCTRPVTHVRASLWIIRINDTSRIASRYGASRRPIASHEDLSLNGIEKSCERVPFLIASILCPRLLFFFFCRENHLVKTCLFLGRIAKSGLVKLCVEVRGEWGRIDKMIMYRIKITFKYVKYV